jgi:histidine triad (HIT) family protein
MHDCIFCKIVKGEIPSYKVYEDPDFMAFLDIKPINKGHVLVISKKHYRWTWDVPEFEEYWKVIKKITKALIKGLHAERVQYITLGETVPHAHVHVVPRYKDDGLKSLPDWDKSKEFLADEMKNISDKIIGQI